jgi:hypothetical protein
MTTEVNYYRLYCQTESNYVYKWDTIIPSKCPNNNTHTVDSNTVTIIDTVNTTNVSMIDIIKTQYQELCTGNKNIIMNLKSSYGKTQLRDNFVLQGTANIINTLGTNTEFQLLTTGTTDKATITSIEKIPYYGYYTNEACLGIRIPQTLSNNQNIQFGIYDNSNGFYFKYTSSGIGVGYRIDGTDSNITQSNLNIDTLNSNGISSILYQASKTHMYAIRISGVGSKIIDYGLYSKSKYGDQRFALMHRLHTNDLGNSVQSLNTSLPFRTEINNNGTSGSNNVYLSERTFGVYGEYNSQDMRQNSVYVSGIVVNSSNTFVPITSIRKKNAFDSLNVYLSSIDAIASSPQIIQITSGSTLTNPSWQAVSGQLSTETAIEYDESASVISNDGVVIWSGYVSEGKTTLSWNKYDGILPKCILNGILPITISAHNASSNGTLGLVIRTAEGW